MGEKDKRINKDELAKLKYSIDYATSSKDPKGGKGSWAQSLGSDIHDISKDIKEYGDYRVRDYFNLDSGHGVVDIWDKNGNTIGTRYFTPNNKYAIEGMLDEVKDFEKKRARGMTPLVNAKWIIDYHRDQYRGGVDTPVQMYAHEEVTGPSSSKELVPYDRKSNKDIKDLEKTLWQYMSEERPYVPLQYIDDTGGPLFKERFSALKRLAQRLGYSGLKMLPWAGMAAGMASGDVMGAVPGVGDLLSSEDVGAGSDQVPYEMKYTPMPILPSWLEMR